MPMQRFTEASTPKWIGSIPSWSASGNRMGMITMMAEMLSMNMPTTMRMMLQTIRKESWPAGQGFDLSSHLIGHPAHRDDPGEQEGAGGDEEHDAGTERGAHQKRAQVPETEFAVDEETHRQAVGDRHPGGLGGGEDPGQDAAEHHHRHPERRKRPQDCPAERAVRPPAARPRTRRTPPRKRRDRRMLMPISAAAMRNPGTMPPTKSAAMEVSVT